MPEEEKPNSAGSEKQPFGAAETAVIFLAILLAGLLLYNSLTVASLGSAVSPAKQPSGTVQKNLPKLELVSITQPGCSQCSDVSKIVAPIRQLQVSLSEKSLEANAPEAQALIKKFGIEKLPTVIVSGEWQKTDLNSNWSSVGVVKDGSLVYSNVLPPFFDLNEKRVKGVVSLVGIKDSTCENCADIETIATELSSIAYVGEKQILDTNSAEAKTLIQKYNISRIPAFILSPEAKEYPILANSWSSIGSIESDGNMVSRLFPVPYLDLNSGKVFGAVEITMLKDSNCSDCFDISAIKASLKNFGLKIVKEQSFDVNSAEAKKLLVDYNISAVPTILLSSGAKEYAAFVNAWKAVGSVEKDGTFILRNLDSLGVKYKKIGQ